jgi:hypothetical protein
MEANDDFDQGYYLLQASFSNLSGLPDGLARRK